MRPNYAQDAPPTAITVGGSSYPCNADYRVWLEVMRLMGELNFASDSDEVKQKSIETLMEMQRMVFGGVLVDEQPEEVLCAMAEFMGGYPMYSGKRGESDDEQVFSFEYDLNYIILAIRNQSGIDLSYRCEFFHWWEFLLEFRTLCGDHYILNLMEIRGYKGRDKEMLRRKRECALPEILTAKEEEEYEAFSALFDTEQGDDDNDPN